MSTKYTRTQIDNAKEELKDASRRFKRPKKRRVTKQVRISIKVHSKVKQIAKERKVTISKLLDEKLS